jgi:hypothetical protein
MRLHQTGIAIAFWVTFVVGLFLAHQIFVRTSIQEPQRLWVGVAAVIPLLWIHIRYGRRFARFSEIDPKEVVSFPLEERDDDVWSAEDLEELRQEAELSEWSEQQRRRDARGASLWRCAACREENPGTFELCWQCNAERT